MPGEKNCRMPVNTLKSVQLFFIEEQIKTLCDFLASQVEELSPWKHKTTNTVRVWRKGNSYLLLVVMSTCCSYYETQHQVPQNLKIERHLDLAIPHWGTYTKYPKPTYPRETGKLIPDDSVSVTRIDWHQNMSGENI